MSAVRAGPVSELCLTTDFNSSFTTYVVQGDSLVNSFANPAGDESAIAVWDDVRTLGDDFGDTGSQYDLAGNLLAPNIYTNTTIGIGNFYDGTSDRTYNYTLAHNRGPFSVYRFDRDWSNGTELFTPTIRSSGITFDAVNDSLWMLNTVGIGTGIQQYSLDGAFLSEFALGTPVPRGYV